MARLVVLSEGFTGKSYDLKVERTSIGRVDDNSFCIADGSLSSHHAEVILRGEEIIIRDLDSTNGSFVDGEPLEPNVDSPIKPGQILRLGEVDVRLEDGAAGEKRESLDQTKVIPKPAQGVGIEKMVAGPKTNTPQTSQFFKPRGDKANKVFIGIFILLGVAVVGLLIFAFFLMGKK
jgi:pSer/pThr/pTyr-binding forkhead associated (FHA) protein